MFIVVVSGVILGITSVLFIDSVNKSRSR